MCITDVLLLGGTIFFCYLSIIGIFNTVIINNVNDGARVVQIIDNEWTGETTPEFEEHIRNSIEYLPSVEEVHLVNKDLTPLVSFGKDVPDFKNLFGSGLKKLITDEYYIPRSEYVTETVEDWVIGFSDTDTASQYTKKIQRTLDIVNFQANSALLDYNRSTFLVFKNWCLLKTNNPDVYVCIKNALVVSNFSKNFAGYLVVLFAIVFLIFFIYEIVRLINFIVGAHKFETFISTDFVTGGKNRDWFINLAQKRIKKGKNIYVIVQLRLEKYRNYCTSYGVKMGENLLEEVSNRLEYLVHKKELSAHIEKADFALLLEYVNEELLEKRLLSIFDVLVSINKSQHLTFVAGTKKVESKTDDIGNLLSEAALALRVVEGKASAIAWFNDSMKEEQIWERRIEDDMEKALENHEFQLYLQPKYATKKENLAAAEALVRWIHPELGFISPGKFIPIFETNGFILKLDDYMLHAVAQRQAKWMSEGKQLIPISVNVSRAHFTREDLAEHICSIVDEYEVPHKYIELELTESAFFDDKNVLLATVNKLKEYGFAVSMDDFGAGYSSLNSLKELPLDVIKLDAQFFREINDINRANLIVGDTISLAKKLGMQIVAEGIETREQVDFLAEQDCDLIQGFYFAKPLPVLDFEKRAYPQNEEQKS